MTCRPSTLGLSSCWHNGVQTSQGSLQDHSAPGFASLARLQAPHGQRPCHNPHVAGAMLGTWAGLEHDCHVEFPTPRRVTLTLSKRDSMLGLAWVSFGAWELKDFYFIPITPDSQITHSLPHDLWKRETLPLSRPLRSHRPDRPLNHVSHKPGWSQSSAKYMKTHI